MKKLFLVALLSLSPLFSFAQETVNRPDVEELLTVMRTEKTMQATMDQVKKMIPQMMTNIASQNNASPAELEKIKGMQDKIMGIVQDEMSWQKIKPALVKIYAESLTPDEVKGITAFYKSQAGQAFLDKMPVIMQKTMAWQQKMMMDMMPKIQAMVQEEVKSSKEAK